MIIGTTSALGKEGALALDNDNAGVAVKDESTLTSPSWRYYRLITPSLY